jgi:hypothetical protein
MPVKARTAKARRPSFSPEAIELFVEIEGMRGDQAFTDRSQELARMLGLTEAWWGGQHVNNRSRAPCHPPGYAAHDDWHHCRRVREQLLAAAKQGKATRPEVGDVLDLRPDPAEPRGLR